MSASVARTPGVIFTTFQVPGEQVGEGALSSAPFPHSFPGVQLTIGEILALAHTVDVHFPDEPYSRPITVSRTTGRMVVVHRLNGLIPLEPKP